MLSVIIIDDEQLILNLLKGIVPWHELGFEVIDTYTNGLEALKVIDEYHPDLVITDICMPEMSGLELLKKIKNASPNTFSLIISGYDNFAYAQEALEYGVLGYLLKPIDEEKFSSLLIKVRGIINEQYRHMHTVGNLEKSLAVSIAQLRYNFFDSIFGSQSMMPFTLPEVNSNYLFTFHEGLFQVLLLQIDGPQKEMDMDVVRNDLERMLLPICYEKFLFEYHGEIVVVLNYSAKQQKALDRELRDFHNRLVRRYGSICNIFLILGSQVTKFSDLGISYTRLHMLQRVRIISPKNAFLDDNFIVEHNANQSYIPPEMLLEFKQALQILDRSRSISICDKIFEYMKSQRKRRPFILIGGVDELMRTIYDFCYNNRLNFKAEFFEDLRNKLDNCPDIETIHHFIMDTVNMIQTSIDTADDNNQLLAQKLRAYVDENFTRDITLQTLSDHFHLSVTYLCNIFSRELGVTFKYYITTCRMDLAKELLCKPGYRPQDIAKIVGYHDVKHFNRIFKKHIGISPSDFRRLFL